MLQDCKGKDDEALPPKLLPESRKKLEVHFLLCFRFACCLTQGKTDRNDSCASNKSKTCCTKGALRVCRSREDLKTILGCLEFCSSFLCLQELIPSRMSGSGKI